MNAGAPPAPAPPRIEDEIAEDAAATLPPPSEDRPAATPGRRPVLALVGNPNCGKTTLFNALTGLRQRVGNYPGVTVERKEGTLPLPDGAGALTLIDLPGLYSLTPHSPDERIARDVLLGYQSDVPRPDAVVNVVDASNLERNLYLTSQLLDLGLPVLVVLTMSDAAAHQGMYVDAAALERALGGVPVISVVASRRQGLPDLAGALARLPASSTPPARRWSLPPLAENELEEMAGLIRRHEGVEPAAAFAEATLLLSLPDGSPQQAESLRRRAPEVQTHLRQDLANFSAAGLDLSTVLAEARYADVGRVVSRSLRREASAPVTLSDKLDRVFLHRFWGYVIFVAVMLVLFQSMWSWASIPPTGCRPAWTRSAASSRPGCRKATCAT
jgi:ferrous iron transport protein B